MFFPHERDVDIPRNIQISYREKERVANLKNQTAIFHIPYYKHEAIPTSVLLRWDFSYILYAKILVKAGVVKRQEKTQSPWQLKIDFANTH